MWLKFSFEIDVYLNYELVRIFFFLNYLVGSHGSFEFSHKTNEEEKAIYKLGPLMVGNVEHC